MFVPRTSARSTTRGSPTAPTTSSPWSARRWSCCRLRRRGPAATLRPLLGAALDNALAHGDAALTGPIVRGDVNTVQGHLRDIIENAPATVPSYVALGRPPPTAPCSTAACSRSAPAASWPCSTTRWRAWVRPARPPYAAQEMSPKPVLASTRGELRLALSPWVPRRRQCRSDASRGVRPCCPGAHDGGPAPGSRRADGPRTTGGRPAGARGLGLRQPAAVRPGEDLDRYPRTLDADLEVCAEQGVDLVFAPAVDEVYPGSPAVTIDPVRWPRSGGEVPADPLRGCADVVAKLLGLMRPDVAVFGEKDYQQLLIAGWSRTGLGPRGGRRRDRARG